MPIPPRSNLNPTSNRNLHVRNIILHGRLHRLRSFLPPRIHRHVLCRTLPAIILQPVPYPFYHRYILKYILPGFRVVPLQLQLPLLLFYFFVSGNIILKYRKQSINNLQSDRLNRFLNKKLLWKHKEPCINAKI